eukprot:296428_1
MRSPQHIDLLLNGYIRNNSYSNSNVSVALIKLCESFYNDIIFMTSKGEELKKMLAAQPGEKFVSKEFVINGLHFELAIYPNGKSDWHAYRGFVAASLFITRASPHSHSCRIYHELCCFEADFQQKGNQYIKIDSTYCQEGLWLFNPWWSKLPTIECKNYNKLTFGLFVDVLFIENQAKDIIFDRHISLPKEIKFEWNLNEMMLYHERRRQFISDNFGVDGNWYLMYSESDTEADLRLNMAKYPISSVKPVNYYVELYCKELNISITQHCMEVPGGRQDFPIKKWPMACHLQMRLKDICFDELNFECKLKMICESAKIQKQSDFEWVLNGSEIENIMKQSCVGKKYFSPGFDNNNFCIYCFQYVDMVEKKREFSFGVKILKFPDSVSVIGIKLFYTLTYNGKVIQFEQTKVVQPDNVYFDEDVLKYVASKRNVNMLSIKVHLEIEIVYDESGNEIECADWKCYGIC